MIEILLKMALNIITALKVITIKVDSNGIASNYYIFKCFFFFIKLGIIIYLDINKELLIGIQNYFFFLCKGMKTWK